MMMMTTDNKHQAIATQGGRAPRDSSAGPAAAAVFAKHILGKYFVAPAARRGPSLVLRMLRADRSAGGPEAAKSATAGSQAAFAEPAAVRLVAAVGRRRTAPLRAAAGIPDVSLPASVIAPRLLVQRKPMLRPAADLRATAPTPIAPRAHGVAVAQSLAARTARAVTVPSGDRSPPLSTALSPPVSSPLLRRPHEPVAARSTSSPDGRSLTLSRSPVDSAAETPEGLFPATNRDSQGAVAGAARTPPPLPHRPATVLPIPAASIGVSVRTTPYAASALRPGLFRRVSVSDLRPLVQRKPMLRRLGAIGATVPTPIAPPAPGVATAQPLAASGDRSSPPGTALSPPVSSPANLVRRPNEPAATRSTSTPDGRSVDRVASRLAAIAVSGPTPLTPLTLSRSPVDSAAETPEGLFPATNRDSQGAVAGAARTPPPLPHRPATVLPIPAASSGVSVRTTPYATSALRPGLFRRVSSDLRPLVQRKPMLSRLGDIGATAPTPVAPPASGVATAQSLAARTARAVAVLGGDRSPSPGTALSPPVSSPAILVRRPHEPVAVRPTSTPDSRDYSVDRVASRPVAIAVSVSAPLTPLALSRSPVESASETTETPKTLFPATSRDSQRAVAGADHTPPPLPHRSATALPIPAASIGVSVGTTPYAISALHPVLFRRVSVPGLRPLVQRRPLGHRNTSASMSKAVSQPSGLNPAAPYQELSAASSFSLGARPSLASGPERPLTLGGFRHFVQHALLGRRGADTVLDTSALINIPAADRLQAMAFKMPTTTLVYGRDGGFSRTGVAQPTVRPTAHRAVPGRPLPAAVARVPYSNDAVEMPIMTHRLDAPAAAQPPIAAALTLQKSRAEVAQVPTVLSATLGAAAPAAPAASLTPDSGPASVVSALSIEALADRIFHILERRLVVERERRGIRP